MSTDGVMAAPAPLTDEELADCGLLSEIETPEDSSGVAGVVEGRHQTFRGDTPITPKDEQR